MSLVSRTFAVLAVIAAFLVAAPTPGADPAASKPPDDPMAGWVPPKVKDASGDKQQIQAFFAKMEAASHRGDIETAAGLIDFPVLMVTDNKKGEASSVSWTREQWVETMKPMFKPMPGVKMTHKPSVFLVSDSLAVASDEWKMTMGGKTMQGRNATLLVRKDGTWKAKSMMEGGWGDMPMADTGAAPPVAK